MLKITTGGNKNSLSLRLEGRVEGPWVDVPRKTWADAISGQGTGEIALDLAGVTFADSEGQKLLLVMKKQGVALIKPSQFLRELLNVAGKSSTTTKSERQHDGG